MAFYLIFLQSASNYILAARGFEALRFNYFLIMKNTLNLDEEQAKKLVEVNESQILKEALDYNLLSSDVLTHEIAI